MYICYNRSNRALNLSDRQNDECWGCWHPGGQRSTVAVSAQNGPLPGTRREKLRDSGKTGSHPSLDRPCPTNYSELHGLAFGTGRGWPGWAGWMNDFGVTPAGSGFTHAGMTSSHSSTPASRPDRY